MTLRKTPTIVVFFVFFSAAAGLMEATGLTSAMGVQSPTGATDALDDSVMAIEQVSAADSVGDTLFGSFVAGARAIEALARGVFAGPLLLTGVGVPAPFVVFLFAPAAIIVAMDAIHYLTGRGA